MTTDPKEITYSREDRDYSAYYDGEYIGSYSTYHAAELALDDHALYIAEEGLDRTATELGGGLIDNEGNPIDPYAPLGACCECGKDAWTTTATGLLCPDHDGVLMEQVAAARAAITVDIDPACGF